MIEALIFRWGGHLQISWVEDVCPYSMFSIDRDKRRPRSGFAIIRVVVGIFFLVFLVLIVIIVIISIGLAVDTCGISRSTSSKPDDFSRPGVRRRSVCGHPRTIPADAEVLPTNVDVDTAGVLV